MTQPLDDTHLPVRDAQPGPGSGALTHVPPQRRSGPPALSADAAFAAYVAEHGTEIRRLATLLVANTHDAEDLAQFALGQALLAWRRHGSLEHPTAYIHRTMVNARTRAWRRRRTIIEILTDRPADDRATESDQRYEDLEHLLQPLRELPPTQRTAVVLRYYRDLSLDETANLMGCSTGAVKAYASRGLHTLREALKNKDHPHTPKEGQRS